MAVIAIANQKGGVGKTTVTLNLSRLLAGLGRRVLAIDLDSQRNLTKGWGVDVPPGRTIYEVLCWQVSIPDALLRVAEHDLLPGSEQMNAIDLAIGGQQRREERLKRPLGAVEGQYDYVLLDCPPALGLATLNALYAATHVLIPVQPEQWPIDSATDFVRNLDELRSNYRPDLKILGIVPNIYNQQTSHHRQGLQYLGELAKTWGVTLFQPISATTKLREATSNHQALCDYDRSTPASDALENLAETLDSRLFPTSASPAVGA
jgi:chromosome partitioning protein